MLCAEFAQCAKGLVDAVKRGLVVANLEVRGALRNELLRC